jgi:translation initiation factor IF-1
VRETEAGETGVVAEQLPAEQFRVDLSGGRQVIAHLAAAVKRDFVRLRVRDEVVVALTANDPARGRIIKVLSRER